MYLLDSCVCINVMRGTLPLTAELMKTASPKLFAVPTVVEAELLTGAAKSKNPAATRLCVERFLAPFQRVDFDSAAAGVYASIRANLEERGCKIGPNDLLIAACAISRGATLITSNVKEFQRVMGLRVENWEEIEV